MMNKFNLSFKVDFHTILAAFVLSLFLTIVSPLVIMSGNITELSSSPYSVMWSSTPYFLLAFIMFSIPALLLRGKLQGFYSKFLCLLLIFSIINSYFLFGDYGEFDGRSLQISWLSQESLLQLVVLVLTSVALFFFRAKYFLYMACLFVFTELFTNGHNVYFGNSPDSSGVENDDLKYDFVSLSKDQPNYLYIILDEVYGQSAQDIFSKNKQLANQYTGFTNYTNTTGVYPTTIASIPAILTGVLYDHTKDEGNYLTEVFSESPLLNKLDEKNFDSKIITLGVYKGSAQENKFSSNFLPCRSLVSHSNAIHDYVGFLNFSIFKAIPEVLKTLFYVDGRWSLDLTLFQAESDTPHISELNYLAQNINASNTSPTFRMFHTTLTHSPARYDRNCNFSEVPLKPTYNNFLSQDICGFSQVLRILKRLKELGIYDNTYIIISSDHGRRYGMSSHLRKKFSSEGIIPTHYSLSHAMLMVKPFNASGPFNNDSTPMSLLDIAPLVIGSINNEPPSFHPERRKFHYYPWRMGDFTVKRAKKETLPPLTNIYSIGEDVQNASCWEKAPRDLYKLIPIAVNDRICFGKNGPNQRDVYSDRSKYVSEGLGKYETWGRWNDSDNINIRFKAAEETSAKEVVLELSSEVKKLSSKQKFEVVLNGTQIGVITLKSGSNLGEEIRFGIPEGLLNVGQYNDLELKCVDKKASSKKGEPRIGFKSMRLS